MTQRRRITFYVNDQAYSLWYGATVEHAVIAHDQRIIREFRENRAWVVDGRGGRVGMGGTLENGVRLYIRYVEEDRPR